LTLWANVRVVVILAARVQAVGAKTHGANVAHTVTVTVKRTGTGACLSANSYKKTTITSARVEDLNKKLWFLEIRDFQARTHTP
jgi:ribose 5-phosphate isomerase RpiB